MKYDDINQLSSQDLDNLISEINTTDTALIILDVRNELEYKKYHIKGAYNIPIDNLSIDSLKKEANLSDDQQAVIVTYCNSGGRGGRAYHLLSEENNSQNLKIKNLTKGINEWIDGGFTINKQ